MAFSACQQVNKLVKGINTDNNDLTVAKVVIQQQYLYDFTGACAYFSGMVAQIHGDAQLKYHQDKCTKCAISSVNCDTRDQCR